MGRFFSRKYLFLPWYFVLFWVTAVWAEDTAKTVMTNLINQAEGTVEQVQINMQLFDSANQERAPSRIFTMLTSTRGKKALRSLASFAEPPNLKGTKILTIRQGDDSGQWLYLPTSRKVTRINSESDSGEILDSDLTFDDIKGESLDEITYQMADGAYPAYAEKQCQEPAYAVAAIPKSPDSASYAKRILAVSRSKPIICTVIYLSKAGKVQKTLQNIDIHLLEKKYWRPDHTRITTYNSDNKVVSRTEMQFNHWKFNVPVKSSSFSPLTLEQ